ncbi:MAG TPA: hypothetical protein PLZ84_07745, partial [Clostridia bacterium]|nr:hypothetical protein [Clostridia bacterium]
MMNNNQMNTNAYDKKDYLVVVLSAILGFLIFDFALMNGLGAGMPIFMITFYSAVFWYFRPAVKTISFELFIPIILLSLSYVLFDNIVLKVFNLLALYLLIPLHLAHMTQNLSSRKYSAYSVYDIINSCFLIPLTRLGDSINIIQSANRTEKKRSATALYILIGLVIAAPLAFITTGILASADAAFEGMIDNIFGFLARIRTNRLIPEIILGVIFAFPLVGLLYGMKHKKTEYTIRVKEFLPSFKVFENAI